MTENTVYHPTSTEEAIDTLHREGEFNETGGTLGDEEFEETVTKDPNE